MIENCRKQDIVDHCLTYYHSYHIYLSQNIQQATTVVRVYVFCISVDLEMVRIEKGLKS